MKCEHDSYNEGCNYCEEVLSYCGYAEKEGYFSFGDVEDEKDWSLMKTYYTKYSDYEPEED